MAIRSKFYMQENEYNSMKMHRFSFKCEVVNHEIKVKIGHHQEKLPNVGGHMYVVKFKGYLRIIQITLFIAAIAVLVSSFVFKNSILCIAIIPIFFISKILVRKTFEIKQVSKLESNYIEL